MGLYLIAECRRNGEKFWRPFWEMPGTLARARAGASQARGCYPLDASGQRFIFERMKTISCWFCIFTLIAAVTPRALAQDSATQQQLDQLSGQIQTIQETL